MRQSPVVVSAFVHIGADARSLEHDRATVLCMGATDLAASEDFWARVPELFRLTSSIGHELETAERAGEVSDALHQLAEALPETPAPLATVDPYLSNAILTATVHALTALDADELDGLRLAVERLRQALRDVGDERPVWVAGPEQAAFWLRDQGISVGDLSDLLSVAESTVRRWTSPEDAQAPSGDNAERLIVLAKIVNHLRHAMTSRGAVQWLLRPHPALDDRRPVDDLKDQASYQRLVHLASGTRSIVAS